MDKTGLNRRKMSKPDFDNEEKLSDATRDSKGISNNDLPCNIHEDTQLCNVPQEFLSGCKTRPLLHIDDLGNRFHYALQPMFYSVIFIFIVELLERFSFYGIYYTLTVFLTGGYNEEWNPGFTSIKASSFVSMSTMVAYTTPFIGAILADSFFGEYKSILFGLLIFYLPGIVLLTISTIPKFLGHEFNENAVIFSLLVLWPLGTGTIKSIVNVFGAKQFHPILQSSLVESYYVNFYMCINVGALAGIALVPIIAQHNITLAYALPCSLIAIGGLLFIAGTTRYVKSPPRGEMFSSKSNQDVQGASNSISLFTIFRITILIVPFCVGYNQLPTTFIVQGMVMEKAFGIFDVASMNGIDALSVLLFGHITASYIYPTLASRNIKLPTTYKFAIGSFLGSLAILWAILVDRMIHYAYENHGTKISVLWQAPSYILVGCGEIFAISASYEVAFQASSPDKKVLASAANIFCIGGIPNLICIFLYHSCSSWFQNEQGNTNIQHIEDYATAKVEKYFFVLLGIMFFGICINILPSVRDFVTSVEQKAADIVRTPALKKRQIDEEAPLFTPQSKKYRRYTKGKIPNLFKMGSMRAGQVQNNVEKHNNV